MVFTAQQAADILSSNAKISADGSVNSHNDVQYSTPEIGQVLGYDGTNWINIPLNIGMSAQQATDIIAGNAKVSADGSINTHNDVNTNQPMLGDILAWDGTNWVNIPATTGISPAQAAAIIEANAKISASQSLSTHDDVGYEAGGLPVTGDVLGWSANDGVWLNIRPINGITAQQVADILLNNLKVSASGSINTHNDVQTTTPSTGQVLKWNGTNWANAPL
jgi:hypothetical protein